MIRVKAMAVVRRGDAVLASSDFDPTKDEVFHRLLGGSVEFGETGEEALRREFREELGAELDEVRRIDVVENLFIFDGRPGHEIVLLHEAVLRDRTLYDREDLFVLDAGNPVVWVPLAEVRAGRARLYPASPSYLS